MGCVGELTRVEGDLADHDPSISKIKLKLDELGQSRVQIDGDIPRLLEHCVRHVGVNERSSVEKLTADAECHFGSGKHLSPKYQITSLEFIQEPFQIYIHLSLKTAGPSIRFQSDSSFIPTTLESIQFIAIQNTDKWLCVWFIYIYVEIIDEKMSIEIMNESKLNLIKAKNNKVMLLNSQYFE